MPFGIDDAIAIGSGILGTMGTAQTNATNVKIAREQMAFQERMSSTAAQRAVEDYRKAGLNPALAYDKGASSPAGASTTIGNAIEGGISNAVRAREVRQQLRIAREQSDADLAVKHQQAQLLNMQRNKTLMENDLIGQTIRFNAMSQPVDLRQRSATALLTELGLPAAKNTADFERRLGEIKPGLASAKTLAEIIKLLKD